MDARPPSMLIVEQIKQLDPDALVMLRAWLDNYVEQEVWRYAQSVRGVKRMPDGTIDSSDR